VGIDEYFIIDWRTIEGRLYTGLRNLHQ
jgi:hypothetical protein